MLHFDNLTTMENRAPRIGMKAESLIRLREGGFNVPDGFVITPDELRSFTDADLAAHADENALYAVRSSGTSEDLGNASFAGQYTSYLNVRGLADLRAAIENCAQSIHSDRVAAYARHNNINIEGSKMAVIVQRMVESEISGVAFSVDSINGRDKEVVIEAVCGLGEQLVSGHVNPAYYSYDWYEDTFTSYKGGALSRPQVKRLAETVTDIQAYYGFPVDVEWAIAGDALFILQSRPITTIHYKAIQGEWTAADGASAPARKALDASLHGLVFGESEAGIFFARPYWRLRAGKNKDRYLKRMEHIWTKNQAKLRKRLEEITELGQAWASGGLLDCAEDIFFLSMRDIESKLSLKKKAAKNRKYYRSFINFKSPAVICGR